ncbi:MAG: hypothetical protein HWN68_17240 [Desulfobacterales bacterium]|nr:hypothetical protein [Desulfobacterales bacterium]
MVKEAKDIMRTLDPADPADWQRPEVKEAASVVVKAVDKAEGQLAEARTKGDVPEDARVFDVGSKGDFSYVQVSEVKRLAVKRGKAFRARADSQRDLAEYRKNGGYDLVAAIRAGNISKIRKAQKAGLFTPADVVQAQLATTQVRQIKTKPKEITSKPIKLRFAQRGRALQIPVGATARVTAGKGREEILAAERQMIQYGKSWVPGWLTKENWQRMTPLERAASIAGDIGQTILYIVPVAKGGSMVIGSQPAATAKGTFPIKGTSLKVFSKGDLKAAIKGAKQKELMTARDLKHLKYSVDISRPVEMPLRIAVVKEGPAGVRFLKATDTIFPVKQRLTPGYSKVTIKPTKTGPATSRVEPLAERMTVEQFLRLQGVLPVSIGTLRATT